MVYIGSWSYAALNIQKDARESKAAKTPADSFIKAFLKACTIRRFLLAVLAFSASSTRKHIFHGLGQSTNTSELICVRQEFSIAF